MPEKWHNRSQKSTGFLLFDLKKVFCYIVILQRVESMISPFIKFIAICFRIHVRSSGMEERSDVIYE